MPSRTIRRLSRFIETLALFTFFVRAFFVFFFFLCKGECVCNSRVPWLFISTSNDGPTAALAFEHFGNGVNFFISLSFSLARSLLLVPEKNPNVEGGQLRGAPPLVGGRELDPAGMLMSGELGRRVDKRARPSTKKNKKSHGSVYSFIDAHACVKRPKEKQNRKQKTENTKPVLSL